MKIQQHDGVVVDAAVNAAGLRRSLRRRKRCWRGEGGARGMGAAALPPPSFIKAPRGGAGPRDGISRGAAAKGGGVPPKASGAPPTLGFPTLGAGGRPKGGAPAH